MKSFTLIIFVFSFASGFSQQTTDTFDISPVVLSCRTYGHIDDNRLDSVNAQYAEFDWKGTDDVSSYYGQNYSKRKELFVKNNRNVPFIFINRNKVFLLNFLYYKGWKPANTTNLQIDGTFLLKRVRTNLI